MVSTTSLVLLMQALHLFIAEHRSESEEESNIELAIQTIGEAQQESLTQELVEFLMGEKDDQPKVGVIELRFITSLSAKMDKGRNFKQICFVLTTEEGWGQNVLLSKQRSLYHVDYA